jgi:hypothetical protein
VHELGVVVEVVKAVGGFDHEELGNKLLIELDTE